MFAVAFVYSMLSGFVLSSASRNKRAGVPNPAILERFGYGLVGVSVAMALCLAYMAATGIDFPPELTDI